MIRFAKLTDYGILLMCQMARRGQNQWHTARDLAVACHLPLPTVSKLLKILLHEGLLSSQRGIKGGYTLSRDPALVSIVEIISAFEGPFALTECSMDTAGVCELESSCQIRDNQRMISQVIRGALERVTLFDLSQPMRLTSIRDSRGNLVPLIDAAVGRTQ
jgi:FeS assembly SUF system regulator